jgi:pimeloyl-ACP methyl ester carboxylesterase
MRRIHGGSAIATVETLPRIHGASAIATVETLPLRDGRRLCVRRWSGSRRTTLVMLHGLLDSSEGWGPLCDRLACTRIAFDLPGFGYSDPPKRGSIQGYARDVAEALSALGVERFTLVGHSLGGAVATALAELMPDRVTGLVLLAPAGFGQIRFAEAATLPVVRNLVQAALPFALSSSAAVATAYRVMVTNGQHPEPELVSRVTGRAAALIDGAREGTHAVVDAGRAKNAFHRRRVQFDGPVYAVWGDHDRLVPLTHRHGVKAAFPQAEIAVWEDMGHHPLRERFDDLLALIARAGGEPGVGRAGGERNVARADGDPGADQPGVARAGRGRTPLAPAA